MPRILRIKGVDYQPKIFFTKRGRPYLKGIKGRARFISMELAEMIIIKYGKIRGKRGIAIKSLMEKIRSRKNPIQISKKTARDYKRFNKKQPKGTSRMRPPKTMVALGERIRGIIYESDKEGKRQQYIHKFKKPYPTGYFSKNPKMIAIMGGGFKVRDWIYD